MPLGVAQVAVQDRHLAEAKPKPLDRLRRETDLRHQDNRLTPVADHLRDGLKINLGLAAAGHAVDEDRLVLLGSDGGEDDVEGLLLIRIHRQLGLPLARRRAGLPATLDSSSLRA